MPVVGTDHMMVERAGVPYKTTAAEVAQTAPALGLWDFWQEERYGSNATQGSQLWLGSAISAGTNNAAPLTAGLGYDRYGIFLRSSATANSGYRYQTANFSTAYFGQISFKFRCQFKWATSFTGRTVRIGYLDTTTSADAVDGAYFEVLDAVCSAKTANNSVRTTAGTTVTLSLDVPYTFDIEVNAAGTAARFRVYAGTNTTPILDQTITTNIPTTTARGFSSGIVATCSAAAASDIGLLYLLADGTIAGFLRARGG